MDQTQSPQLQQHIAKVHQWRKERNRNYAAKKKMSYIAVLDLIISLCASEQVIREMDSVVDKQYHSSSEPVFTNDTGRDNDSKGLPVLRKTSQTY